MGLDWVEMPSRHKVFSKHRFNARSQDRATDHLRDMIFQVISWKKAEKPMSRIILIILAIAAAFQLSACAVAVGAGGVVLADEALERKNGGDGLF